MGRKHGPYAMKSKRTRAIKAVKQRELLKLDQSHNSLLSQPLTNISNLVPIANSSLEYDDPRNSIRELRMSPIAGCSSMCDEPENYIRELSLDPIADSSSRYEDPTNAIRELSLTPIAGCSSMCDAPEKCIKNVSSAEKYAFSSDDIAFNSKREEISGRGCNEPEKSIEELSREERSSAISSDHITFDSKSEEISGRRIVKIDYFFNQILNSARHTPFDCSIVDMELMYERRKGMLSTFVLKCKMCNKEEFIHNEEPDSLFNINTESTLGAISIGVGYSQMNELLSTLNMPYMSNNTYQNSHTKISEVLHNTAWQSMNEAAEEEKALAIQVGDVNIDGIPEITVICDGAWSKRSYRTNYNAASGVGCIVGARTGKLLFLGVRNKYCACCAKAKTNKETAKEHRCFLNWQGPSTGMETDIIAEGFKESIQMHGLIYKRLVGDGDSSVFNNLLKIKPYGQHMITKIECRNHLLRNLCNKLREVANRKKSVATNCPVPPKLRQCLKNNILKIRSSIRKATLYRIKEDILFQNKVDFLNKDILNSISHIFGEHEKCLELKYFCTGETKDGEINMIPAMKECGMYTDIKQCLYRLVHHSSSLVTDMDNNYAESYNSVLCKFVGGKRINFSQKGSYVARAEAAALSFNKKGKFHSTVHDYLSTKKTNKIFLSKYVSKVIAQKQAVKKHKQSRMRTKRKKTLALPDKFYGNIENTTTSTKVINKDIFLQNLKKSAQEIKYIEECTRGQSNSALWFEERSKRLTASNFGEICRMRKTTSPNNKVKAILYSKFTGSDSTKYGQENEPIAIETFQNVFNTTVRKCGLFIDSEYFYLGASPDGIIDENTIIEVKCPISCRKLNPRDGIKSGIIKYAIIDDNGDMHLKKNHKYYYQVQGQLQICNKSICYFIIWSPEGIIFEKIRKDEIFWNDMVPKLKDFYFNSLLPEILKPQLNN